VLFQKRFWEGIRDGSVTITFRRWKRPQAVAGRRYRTPAGMIEVESVDIVVVGDISDRDARRAGHRDAAMLIADLPGADPSPIYRIAFHHVKEADPRDLLAADAALTVEQVREIDRRLDRYDAASSYGPWTRETLAIIAQHPEVRAGDLADMLGRERSPFKLDVRKLKNLGLTLSLRIGYRLSPRGLAYLRLTERV
jgi:hypothetical protein